MGLATTLIAEKIKKNKEKDESLTRVQNAINAAKIFGGEEISEKLAAVAKDISTPEGASFLEDLLKTQIKTAATARQTKGKFSPGTAPPGQPPFQPPTLTGGEKVKEAQLEVVKQAAAQGAKASELAGRDVARASAAVDTGFDEAISFGEVQLEKFGLRPGQLLGVVDKLIPSEANKFKDSLQGASREGAALIARQIIPGVRAANITKIFEKSISTIGKTMESNAENSGASMGNAFANALSQNIKVVNEATGTEVPIQDITIDPASGRPLSKLGFQKKLTAINTIKRNFRNDLSKEYMERVFKRNPALLQPETRKNIEDNLPSFNSEEEGDAALAPGKLYKVGDQILEAA